RGKLLRWTEQDGVVDWRDSEQSNGNTLDLQGKLLSAQHGGRNLVRHHDQAEQTPAGAATPVVRVPAPDVLATSCDGKKFHPPDDLAARNDGTIWFTDPTYGLGTRAPDADVNFVYRPDEWPGQVAIVRRDFAMPTGICLAADGPRTYVAGSGDKPRVGPFSVLADGTSAQPMSW